MPSSLGNILSLAPWLQSIFWAFACSPCSPHIRLHCLPHESTGSTRVRTMSALFFTVSMKPRTSDYWRNEKKECSVGLWPQRKWLFLDSSQQLFEKVRGEFPGSSLLQASRGRWTQFKALRMRASSCELRKPHLLPGPSGQQPARCLQFYLWDQRAHQPEMLPFWCICHLQTVSSLMVDWAFPVISPWTHLSVGYLRWARYRCVKEANVYIQIEVPIYHYILF